MFSRQDLEAREYSTLAPYAVHSPIRGAAVFPSRKTTIGPPFSVIAIASFIPRPIGGWATRRKCSSPPRANTIAHDSRTLRK